MLRTVDVLLVCLSFSSHGCCATCGLYLTWLVSPWHDVLMSIKGEPLHQPFGGLVYQGCTQTWLVPRDSPLHGAAGQMTLMVVIVLVTSMRMLIDFNGPVHPHLLPMGPSSS